MYEEVIDVKKKTAREWRLTGVVTLAVVLMLFVTAVLVGGYRYYSSFRTYVADFSQTTSINYRKGSVTVTTAEESFELSNENIYFVYNCIINMGRGRIGEPPDRQPDAVLEYEFGGTLELWNSKVENSRNNMEYGLFIRYRGVNGYEYAYDTDRLYLERLPLTAKENLE